jgi:hypothetical protein
MRNACRRMCVVGYILIAISELHPSDGDKKARETINGMLQRAKLGITLRKAT